jgi:hypothetical protein
MPRVSSLVARAVPGLVVGISLLAGGASARAAAIP